MSSLTPRTVDGGFTVIDSVRLSNKTERVRFSRNSIPSLKLNQKILTKTNVKCDKIIAV